MLQIIRHNSVALSYSGQQHSIKVPKKTSSELVAAFLLSEVRVTENSDLKDGLASIPCDFGV